MIDCLLQISFNLSKSSKFGEVNGWCSASHLFFSLFHSTRGKSTTHSGAHKSKSIKFARLANSKRNAPKLEKTIDERTDLDTSFMIYEDLSKEKESDRYQYIFPDFTFTKDGAKVVDVGDIWKLM